MTKIHSPLIRARKFCEDYALQVPILMAPMAGSCPPALAIAVANGGGLGACGALSMQPDAIGAWAKEVRAGSNGAFMMNLWIPDPAPVRDAENEAALRDFLSAMGPDIHDTPAEVTLPDFDAQCEAMLAAGPSIISSIMGLYPAEFVAKMKAKNIRWFATATTVTEAVAAAEAGADVIVAQGMEAGGHRGAFNAEDAERAMVGLFALLPAVVDAVDVPVVATGGIGDARGVTAAFMLGASAVQVGTALLRAPEAGTPAPWADAMTAARPEHTTATHAYSGRLGRAIRNPFTEASAAKSAPRPAPFPIQRNLTAPMGAEALATGNIDTMKAWAGQSASFARAVPAADIVADLWRDAEKLLG